jgi:hypothetical protein
MIKFQAKIVISQAHSPEENGLRVWCNPSAWEAEPAGLGMQGEPGLQSRNPVQKKKKRKSLV